MSSSSSRTRGRVLRDGAGFRAADLGTVRAGLARDLVVDPALVEQATEDGYRAGYDAGFNAGIEDSAAAIESRERVRGEQVRTLVDRLADEVDTVAARHAVIVDETERRIVAIAFEIAEMILARELRVTDHRAADAIGRALRLAPPSGPVLARLHPDDLAAIGDTAALAPGRAITIAPDPTLAPGDAIVDVGPARIDARIAPALDRIREVLES